MKKLNVGDLALFKGNEWYTDTDALHLIGSVVRITDEMPEFMVWDYFAEFPNGKILEVHEDELEPLFSF